MPGISLNLFNWNFGGDLIFFYVRNDQALERFEIGVKRRIFGKTFALLVKDQILKDIKSIESPVVLHQVYEYLQLVKHSDAGTKPNRERVLKFAGTLTKAEAKRISEKVNEAFNQIEGEW